MDKILVFEFLSFIFLSGGIGVTVRPKKLVNKMTISNLYVAHGVLTIIGIIFLNLHLRESASEGQWLPNILKILIGLTILSGVFGLTSMFLKKYRKLITIRDKWIKRKLALWIHRVSLLLYSLVFLDLYVNLTFEKSYLYVLIIEIIYISVVFLIIYSYQIKRKKYVYTLLKNNALSDDIRELVLESQSKVISLEQDQFVFMKPVQSSIGKESHPFSVSGGGSDNQIILRIKKNGDFTKEVSGLKEGTKVFIEGPYSNFPSLSKETCQTILIAGGIGITAFIELINKRAHSSKENVVLLWSVSYISDLFYLKELEDIAKKNKNFSYQIFLTRESNVNFHQGRITKESIKNNIKLDEIKEIVVMVSANYLMTRDISVDLADIGFNKKQVLTNSFLF